MTVLTGPVVRVGWVVVLAVLVMVVRVGLAMRRHRPVALGVTVGIRGLRVLGVLVVRQALGAVVVCRGLRVVAGRGGLVLGVMVVWVGRGGMPPRRWAVRVVLVDVVVMVGRLVMVVRAGSVGLVVVAPRVRRRVA